MMVTPLRHGFSEVTCRGCLQGPRTLRGLASSSLTIILLLQCQGRWVPHPWHEASSENSPKGPCVSALTAPSLAFVGGEPCTTAPSNTPGSPAFPGSWMPLELGSDSFLLPPQPVQVPAPWWMPPKSLWVEPISTGQSHLQEQQRGSQASGPSPRLQRPSPRPGLGSWPLWPPGGTGLGSHLGRSVQAGLSPRSLSHRPVWRLRPSLPALRFSAKSCYYI